MLRLSFHRFFGLPRLRSPCGRSSLAIFARRLSSILFTWASHPLLLTLAHLTISWIPLSCWSWSLRILSLKFSHVSPLVSSSLLFGEVAGCRFCLLVFLGNYWAVGSFCLISC
jgi:hypothetical protein